MGGIVGKSKHSGKGDSETGKAEIERLRLSRKQQYDLFKFILDKPEGDIVQHVHDVPEIPTAVMHFKVYYMDYPQMHCNCAYIVEQGLSSDGPSPISAVDLLENCIKFGYCPHWILDRDGAVDVLKHSINLEDVYNKCIVEEETTASSTKSSSAGLYLIHLLLIFGKIRLFQKMLKSIQWDRIPKYMLFTCLHRFSPFHLAVIHNFDTLFDCLMMYFKNILFSGCVEYLGYRFGEHATVLDFASRMEKIEILRKLVVVWKTKPAGAMAFAVTNRKLKSIVLFKEHGVSLGVYHFTFDEAIQKSIENSDKEWLSVLLELKEANGREPNILNTTVIAGSIEILSLVIEKLFTNLKKSKSRKQVKNCLARSVLLHDVRKAEILIRVGIDVNSLYHNSSVLFWSENLGLIQMSKMLKKNGAKSFTAKKDNNDDFLENVISANVNTLPNVQYLIEQGFDVNGKNKKGYPILDAVQLEDFDTVEYLLSHGAETNSLKDVYYNTFNTKKKLLVLFIKLNVDLSTDGKFSMFNISKDFHPCLKLLLLTAHTMSKTDTEYLRSNYLHEDYINAEENELCEIIEKMFYCPKSLQLNCRDLIRKHAGRSFIKYINQIKQDIPTQILKFLQCENLLEIFEEETKNINQHYPVIE